MGPIQYFISGAQTLNSGELAAVGLGYLGADGALSPRGCGNGPEGLAGVTVCVQPHSPGWPKYTTDGYAWREIPAKVLDDNGRTGDRRVFLGVPDGGVSPESLARREQLPGHVVTMAEGGRWLIPVGQQWALPMVLKLDADGNFVESGTPPPSHARVWEIVTTLMTPVVGGTDAGEDSPFAMKNLARYACELIAINYRVSTFEISELGLLTYSVADAVAAAAMDLPTFEAWRDKKKEQDSDGGATSHGDAD